MRETLRLELIEGDGDKRESEVFAIARPTLINEAEVGRVHREAKTRFLSFQQHWLAQQIAAYAEAKRQSQYCGARCARRDHKTRVLGPVFREVKVRSSRSARWSCVSPTATKIVSPISRLLPRRCTRELAVVRACLRARMPYREAAWLMDVFVPAATRRNAKPYAAPRRTSRTAKPDPASNNRRSHWVNDDAPVSDTQEERLAGGIEKKGRWWSHWFAWLGLRSKKITTLTAAGNRRYRAVEPAPGRYMTATV